MPPRPRTPSAPSRRPRVAGLRDPRRQESEETPAEDTASPSPAPPTFPTRDTAPAPGPTRDDDAGGTTAGSPSGVDLRKGAAPAREDTAREDTAAEDTAATEAPATETPATGTATDAGVTAAPTRASRPRPTGRADRTKRRPAPSTGRAVRSDDRRARDHPHGRIGRAAAAVGTRTRRLVRTRVAFPVTLVVIILVAATLATLAFLGGRAAYTGGPIANTAVVDAAATAEVVGASRQVVEQALSYDWTKLDDTAAAARNLGTGPFLAQFSPVYDSAVRPAATQQQLRQTATVLNIGVRSIEDDRADVIVFAQFTLQRAGGQSATSAGLLDLTMARVDGRWKLFDFKPLTAAP